MKQIIPYKYITLFNEIKAILDIESLSFREIDNITAEVQDLYRSLYNINSILIFNEPEYNKLIIISEELHEPLMEIYLTRFKDYDCITTYYSFLKNEIMKIKDLLEIENQYIIINKENK